MEFNMEGLRGHEALGGNAEVRAREELFRSLVENSSDTVSLLALDGIVRYQSPSVHKLLGYTSEELAGSAHSTSCTRKICPA